MVNEDPPAPYSFHPTFPYPTSRNENARGIDRQHPTNDVHHKAKRRFAYCKEELASPKFLVQRVHRDGESKDKSVFACPSSVETVHSFLSLSLPLCLFVSHSESAGLTVDRVQPFNLAMRHQQASGYHGLLIAHVRLAEANGSFLRQSIKSSRRKNGREEKKETKRNSRDIVTLVIASFRFTRFLPISSSSSLALARYCRCNSISISNEIRGALVGCRRALCSQSSLTSRGQRQANSGAVFYRRAMSNAKQRR